MLKMWEMDKFWEKNTGYYNFYKLETIPKIKVLVRSWGNL